jgi:hypothetical protein
MTAIHLSHWVSDAHARHPGGHAWVPAVMLDYTGGQVIGAQDPSDARTLVYYRQATPEQLLDWRYPLLSEGATVRVLATTDRVLWLEEYRAAMRAAHDVRLRQIRVRYTAVGREWDLPATLAYQVYLAGVAQAALLGVTPLGLSTGAGSVDLHRQQVIEVVRAYCDEITDVAGRYCDESVDHLTLRGEIEAAPTIADLDSIVID